MPTNDEELLVLKAKRGDEKALLVLDQWYRKKVVNIIMGRLFLPREDSEEIYQEAVFRAIKTFQEDKNMRFINWLLRIAIGYGITRTNKAKKYRNMKDSYREYGALDPICVEPSQENKMSDILNILRECLNEKHYEMIKLHYVEGYHWDELAGSFGYSSPDSASHAVRKALKKALSRVRRYLQEG